MDQLSPVDERLETVERVAIEFAEFRDALRRNYLDPTTGTRNRSTFGQS